MYREQQEIDCLLSSVRKYYIMRQQKPIIFLWIVRRNGTREINLFYHPLYNLAQTRRNELSIELARWNELDNIPQLARIVFQIRPNSDKDR